MITGFSRLSSKAAPTPFALAYEFARDGRLDAVKGPAITFTRASPGSRFDNAGVLQTPGNDVARFDHSFDGTNWNALGLLIEEARTTLYTRSEEFDHADWTKTRSSISANAIAAPDGNPTADKLVEDSTASSSHLIKQNISWISGTTYVLTRLVKVSERTEVHLRFAAGAAFPNNAHAYFDLSAGTVLSEGSGADSSGIEDVGDGWYLCWVTATATGTASTGAQMFLSSGGTATYSGDGSSGVFLWGADVGAGTFPLSYIATLSAAATRAADVATITDLGFLDPAANTWLVKGRTALGGGLQVFGQIDDGDENERIRIERNVSDEIHFIVTDGGVDQADLNLGTIADDTDLKVAVAWAAGDFAGSLDGAAVVTDAAGAVPTGLTTKRLGRDSAGNHWNRTIKRDVTWPSRLPDGVLQSLTT